MSEFKKGDKVTSGWGRIPQTVEAVSPDGKYLWLVDENGSYCTYEAGEWTVIPKFFEAGKEYRSTSGSLIYIHHVTKGLNGKPVALAENVSNGSIFALRSEHADMYDL